MEPQQPEQPPLTLSDSLQTALTAVKTSHLGMMGAVKDCVSAVNSNAALLEALLNILYTKGIITKEEFLAELNKDTHEQQQEGIEYKA